MYAMYVYTFTYINRLYLVLYIYVHKQVIVLLFVYDHFNSCLESKSILCLSLHISTYLYM